MIYILNNKTKFFLSFNLQEVLFILWTSEDDGPRQRSSRWLHKNAFKNDHMQYIADLLGADEQSDRNIGLAILQQTLKVRIDGEVIARHDL